MFASRKLRATLDEYTTRVGQQAIVLCISPSKPNPVFKVFGAAPLENVVSVRSFTSSIKEIIFICVHPEWSQVTGLLNNSSNPKLKPCALSVWSR